MEDHAPYMVRHFVYISRCLERHELPLRQAQYYKESGMVDASRKSASWNNNKSIKKSLTAMSRVSSKGSNFANFRNFVGVYLVHKDKLW
jgi:hypothetical protein